MKRMKAKEMLEKFYIPALEQRQECYSYVQERLAHAMKAGRPGFTFKGYGDKTQKSIVANKPGLPFGMFKHMMRMLEEDNFNVVILGKQLIVKWVK